MPCLPLHAAARESADSFIALTVRLPHYPHEEAYQRAGELVLWLRNCPHCKTTISREVRT